MLAWSSHHWGDGATPQIEKHQVQQQGRVREWAAGVGPKHRGLCVWGGPESSQYYRKVQRDMATLERPPQGWEAGAHGRPGRWPPGLKESGQTQEGP